MAVVADSGAVYAIYDRRDAFHAGGRAAIETERDRIFLPSPILGEIDYLLRVRLGNRALLKFLTDIQEGAFTVESLTLADFRRCALSIAKYQDLDLGLCDASVVAVAERIRKTGARYVVIKGGHLTESADDVVAGPEGIVVLPGERVDTGNDHGTGCSLSAAIS